MFDVISHRVKPVDGWLKADRENVMRSGTGSISHGTTS